MTQRRDAVAAKATFGGWTPITVHLTGEISVRVRDVPYKGAMFAAYPGDVVFSKIDARNGAIGVLPADIDKAVVTPEFPVFVADPARLDGQFVKLVLRTGGFIEALKRKASGTSGRKRITPEAFQDLRIPLPPLAEQMAIVAAWRDAVEKAMALEAEAVEIERQAVEAFDSALGYAPSKPLPDRPVFIANFKHIDRWSHEGILRAIVDGASGNASALPMVELGNVIADLENGWSPKCLSRPAESHEWGVLKLGAVSFGAFDQSENKALPKHLKPRPALEVTAGQVLISRANVTRLVGATALVRHTRDKLMLCDKIFRVVPLDTAPILPAFLTEVLRTSDVRRQIEAKVTGTSPTMKNISKPALLGLRFPLPQKADQEIMVNSLEDARGKSAALLAAAANIRAQARIDLESTVYAGEKPETGT